MVGTIIQSWHFADLVRLSGYRNVVTTNFPPTAVVHDGAFDERVLTNGVAAYYISETGLSPDEAERSRQLLDRLYRLGDWAAGEIVERHMRDQERLVSGYHQLKPRLTVHQMFVRRFIKANPGSSASEIATGTNLSPDIVERIIDELCSRDILLETDQRNATYVLTDSEIARYAAAVIEDDALVECHEEAINDAPQQDLRHVP